MSIVASVFAYNILEPDGSRLIHEQHTDSTGKTHSRFYKAAAGTDVVAARTAYAAELEMILAEQEADEVIQ